MEESKYMGTLRRWLIRLIVALVILPPLVFGAWAWITLHYTYSRGERTGYIQKISQKGWLCKTWEGELAMANLPGTMPQIFSFSVRDPEMAKKVSGMSGQRVTLTYDQHRGVPTQCFGETEYFITGVQTSAAP